MGSIANYADFRMDSQLADAAAGNYEACYELGVVYSTGLHGVDMDLIQAHKWFNLAAVRGDERAQACRAEVSEEMTAREIVEAQRQARAWLQMVSRQAA